MRPENIDLLRQGLGALGLVVPEPRIQALVAYHDFLLATHAAGLNLTGHEDERESVVKNVLDSLAPWRAIVAGLDPASSAVGDVGAGGGPTGIALALTLNLNEVVLLESKQKRCKFLRDAVEKVAAVIAPRRVTVFEGDAAQFPKRLQRLVFRAFGRIADIIRVSDRILAPHGLTIAYKGRRERIDEELAELAPTLKARCRVESVVVPFLGDDQRHVVSIKAK